MQARLTIDELHQLKWLIGGLLALLSLWALNGLDLIGFGLNSIAMLGISVALLKPVWVHAIPESIWSRFVVPFILVFVLVDFGLGFTSLVAPLMRMVILLLIYRALAPRNHRREDLQMLLLCLFSIVVSGALTVSLLFAVQILLFTPIAMAFLLIVCLLDKGADSANYRPSWDLFSLKRLIKRVWRAVEIRAVVLGGILFAIVVAISTGLFILIPRFDLGQTVPFMQMETKPRSGFSETVSLNSISEIVEDQSISLRIDMPNLASIRSLPYWRVLVLDSYEDGEFRLSQRMGNFRNRRKLRELSEWTHRRVPADLRKRDYQWTFYFEGSVSRYLPLPTLFQTIRFTREHEVQLFPDLHVIGLDSVQKSTFSYQIDTPVWEVRALASNWENDAFDCYSNGCDHVAEQMADYPLTTLDMALGEDERRLLSELNAKLIGNADTLPLSTAQYSERIVAYLRNNFKYSLKPYGTGGGGDPIVNWLKNGSAGHCELYAGAFVLLAREAGYPARMVVGFVGGSWNSVENFFVVRNSNAHAWVEIYDFESKEWLRVDPTPGNSNMVNLEASETVDFKFEVETGMFAWVDSLRIQWYRRIISFDQDDQLELATSLIDLGDSFLKKLSAGFKESMASLKAWIAQPFSRWNLLRLAVVLGICCGVFVLWRGFCSWSHLLFRLSRKHETLSPIRKQAARYMAKVRVQIDNPDADEAYVRTLRDAYAQLEALRFGPHVSAKTAGPVFKGARKALRSRKWFVTNAERSKKLKTYRM